MPAPSAAATPPPSRPQPPGCTIVGIPASIARPGPSGEGEEGSRAITGPPRREPPRVALEDRVVLLLGEDRDPLVVVAGREQHLHELLVQPLRQSFVAPPVERDHAAERAQRVTCERGLVGLARIGRDRRA